MPVTIAMWGRSRHGFSPAPVAPLVDEVTHMRPDDFGVAVIKPIDTAITVDAQLNGLWQ